MLDETSINLGNLLLSFSDAIDLANPSVSAHQMRVTFIAMEMAKEAKLSQKETEKIFIGALLHDAGALSPEEKTRIHNFEDEENVELHCKLGASLYETTPLLKPAAEIVRHHHKPWREWHTAIDDPNVFETQVLYLADHLERYIKRNEYILHQQKALIEKITSLSGSEIHPDVVDSFIATSKREEFWLDLVSPRLYSILLRRGPFVNVTIKGDEIFSIASFFRKLIDYKSHFTATHSTGVAEHAVALSEIFGLASSEVSSMKLAGYFHDIGKLAVPNTILEKPGKLTEDEFSVMRKHTYYTYDILKSIGGLGQIPEWAAFHHEKLDGTGYPFHIDKDELSTGSRIMAIADIFTALAEDRPYRKGMQKEEIEEILRGLAKNNEIDNNIVNMLFDNYEAVLLATKEQCLIVNEDYNKLITVAA